MTREGVWVSLCPLLRTKEVSTLTLSYSILTRSSLAERVSWRDLPWCTVFAGLVLFWEVHSHIPFSKFLIANSQYSSFQVLDHETRSVATSQESKKFMPLDLFFLVKWKIQCPLKIILYSSVFQGKPWKRVLSPSTPLSPSAYLYHLSARPNWQLVW